MRSPVMMSSWRTFADSNWSIVKKHPFGGTPLSVSCILCSIMHYARWTWTSLLWWDFLLPTFTDISKNYISNNSVVIHSHKYWLFIVDKDYPRSISINWWRPKVDWCPSTAFYPPAKIATSPSSSLVKTFLIPTWWVSSLSWPLILR